MKPYSVIWISASAAIIAGLYFTRNANCLWAFFIPAFMKIEHNPTNDSKGDLGFSISIGDNDDDDEGKVS